MGFNSAFKGLIYPSSGACDCVVELPRLSCSQFVACWRFGAAGFGWCSFCRLKHKHVRVSDIINIVCLLHVSATLMAILREVHYKGYISEFLNQAQM